MGEDGGFVMFQRSDGTQVACQLSTILFVTRGDRGTILHFGGGTQLNLRDEFEEVTARLGLSQS